MDPLTLGIGAIGLGLQFFGGAEASSKAKEAYGIQANITGIEGQVNDQRRQAMELSARRQQMEIFRNQQRARSMATNAAVSQGAQFGSGLQGGLAQVDAQSNFNLQGVNENLSIGRNIFSLDDQISKQKLALSGVQGEMATAQGISTLGGSILKSSGTIGNIFGSFGGKADLSAFGFNPIRGASGQ